MRKKALLISCFDWYEKRLRLVKEVIKQEYNVTILTSDFDHATKKTIHRISDCDYIHVSEYKKNISIARVISHFQFGKKCEKYLLNFQPDLIYVLIPPNNVAQQCLNYVKSHQNVKFIVDIIDLWPESMPIGKIHDSVLGKKWRWLRDESILNSDRVITECKLYNEKLCSYLPNIEPYTLYLYKEDYEETLRIYEDKIKVKSLKRNNMNEIVLGYLGSINHIIDIEVLVKTVNIFKEKYKSVKFVIIGDGEKRDQLIQKLKKIGVDIIYHGKIFDEERKCFILSQCDYVFNVMVQYISVGLTIKSIDYFSYGLPLVNNIKGDTWELIEEYNAGINLSDDWNDNTFKINNITKKMIIQQSTNSRNLFIKQFTTTAFKNNLRRILEGI